jgi:hypothetical protein
MNHSIQISPKVVLVLFIMFAFVSSSCKKTAEFLAFSEETSVKLKSGEINPDEYTCNPKTTPLIAGQSLLAGMVKLSINPGSGNMLLSVTTTEGWELKSIRHFIGEYKNLPFTGGGKITLANFPGYADFPSGQTAYYFEYITGTINPYAVAVYAEVIKNGEVYTAWAQEIRYNKNSKRESYYIDYPLMPCGAPTSLPSK